MSEFIISSEQLERLIEGIEHNTGREVTKVVCDGTELDEIVRCRDCYHYRDTSTKHARSGGIGTCDLGLEWTDLYSIVEPSGFCALGERVSE